MYAEDSFFTLSQSGQLGLAVLSLALFALTIAVTVRLTRAMTFITRAFVAVVVFWLFVWLTPQIYYLYYLMLFEGLSLQNVIHSPPSLLEIIKLVTFRGDATLSAHSQGVLAWALVVVVLRPPCKRD